ncbi:NUDIX hydrolase [Corynebacterium pseudopelargi]|uniref:NUDIX domain protein n=1 Tax=Corynebacterium pseudopelargi TaxID=2080757 RepID=A0A3G6IV15_9CORY|nr:NUDIX hydrolase [Corynebacterium pseudopelargi]AZA09456.1 NUDIX domain protein [Corynebacterium pseudopelargi]
MTSATALDGRRLAATVLLLRDSVDGLEVYVQERVSSMPTFPNTTVFPGGGVDPRDFLLDPSDNPLIGDSLEHWAQSLHVNQNQAQALLFAAVRELFEETGTFLVAFANGKRIGSAAPFHQQRIMLESHQMSLAEVLDDHNLKIRTDLLRPFARWHSPKQDRHQFDVFSFVAVQPPGQEPDGNTPEVASTGWFAPSLVLDGWRAGLLRLVLPTWAQLKALSHFNCVQDVLEHLKDPNMQPMSEHIAAGDYFEEFMTFQPPRRF